MTNAFAALAQQRRFVYLLIGVLSLLGIAVAFRIPSAIYPELTFSRITIVVTGSSLGGRQVLFGVTRPIEEAVSIVPGVVRVQSRTIRGSAEINVTFSEKTDLVVALQQVQARVNQVEADLPPGLEIEIERLTPSLFPILSYNLEGGDPPTLYDIATYQIRPLFARVPGVGRVDVQASDVRELEVVADPARLVGQQLTFEDLAAAIRGSSTVSAVGRVPANYKQYLVVTTTEAHTPDDVANIVISRGLRVRDVANVIMGTEDHVRIVAGDGKPAALLNVTRQIGGNTVAIADSIAAIARTVAPTLPPGVHLKAVYDQAALVRDAVRSVRDAMLIGAVLAVVVLLLFLRHARITAISASAIPLTMALTVFVMWLLGQTFNLMTLGAMAIAIGLVIDDAVVVTENIVRHLHMQRTVIADGAGKPEPGAGSREPGAGSSRRSLSSEDRAVAVRESIRELIWPVTSSTITTVVVFLPLGLLTGVEGQFFHALSIVLTIAVLVSLLLSLTIIPLLAEEFLTAEDADADATADEIRGRGILDRMGRALDRLSERYERALGDMLHRGRWMLGAAAVLIAAGLLAHHYVGTGFLPEMDEGAFVLDYFTPGGTALAETDRELHIAESILAATPEISGTSRSTGAELGLFATEQNTGDIAVRLKDPGHRSRSSFEIIDDVRGKINAAVPRLHIEFVQILSDVINDLAGAANPVEVKLFGPDLAQLEAYGEKLGEKLEEVPGIEDLFNGVSEPTAELAMSINQAEANRAGMTPADVASQVQGALLGVDAGTMRLEDRSVNIRARAPDSVRFDQEQLPSLPILAPATKTPVQLGSLATFTPGESRAELLRENQQQMIDVTADIADRSLGAVMNDVKKVVRENPPPAGVRLELAGQYASQQQAFRALMVVLALAAVSVVAVMLIQFESFIEPLVILLAAPLSFVGAMLLLLITGTPLNVSSFMGLILLVGLIVKNGIILLDFTRRRMLESGVTLEEAIREAARIRLRPILMTTLCTLFGLLPLALGLGAGAEMQRPLALAVIGGLALSTPVTLFLVPSLLVAIRGADYRFARAEESRAGAAA
ncbi:MAG TPA: efflux RND transporter permease subunit [Gemmatimonadaceae bacterium]|nr:efflux RND transporter permease subunit [Gemmatimonadaceae bacterium]